MDDLIVSIVGNHPVLGQEAFQLPHRAVVADVAVDVAVGHVGVHRALDGEAAVDGETLGLR